MPTELNPWAEGSRIKSGQGAGKEGLTVPQRDTVIFDLGGVLLDWNPRHLYRGLFAGDEAAMEHFLANVCNSAWNVQQDAGRLVAEACAQLKAMHPDKGELIDAYYARHLDMIAGAVEGTVEILAELRERGTKLYFLSNYSAETYPLALGRFEFLSWFADGIVSGEHGIIKPDPAIYRLLIERCGIDPLRAAFIDDNPINTEAARAFGIHGIHFTNAEALRAELAGLKLL
jgi:2-haloacid dehalogenase